MRAAYSVWAGGETKEKPAGETGRRKRMRGIVGYFTVLMAWINIFFFSQKKKIIYYCALEMHSSVIKLYKVPQGQGGKVDNTLERMKAGDGSGHMRASEVVNNVLFLDLSSSDEDGYCINSLFSVALGNVGKLLFFQFKMLPISG